MRDDGNQGRAGQKVSSHEGPPQHRRNTGDRAEAGSDRSNRNLLRRACAGNGLVPLVQGDHRGKGAGFSRPIEEIGGRHRKGGPARSRVAGVQRDQSIRLREGEWAEHDATQHREHRRIQADPQRQHQKRRCGEDRRPPQGAQREPEVAERRRPPLPPSPIPALLAVNVPALLGKAGHRSEATLGLPPCV